MGGAAAQNTSTTPHHCTNPVPTFNKFMLIGNLNLPRLPAFHLLKEHRLFFGVLLLGLLYGLVYLNLIPPWQHYDEPTQFEYAWLIANRPGFPVRGDYDQSIRREIAASMVEHNFFRDLSIRPNLISEKPIWIGISQIGELPLYYWIAALPLRFTFALDVAQQLISMRLISLAMYLVTILAAYGIAAEITSVNHPLRWLLPISIILVPSFVDIMTAVNDDVGAVAFFSLFLWAGVRLITKGFSWFRVGILILLAAICFWTKNTVVVVIFLVFIPILFALFRGDARKYAWLVIAGGFIVFLVAAFDWGDAAFWYKSSSLPNSTSVTSSEAILGEKVIRIDVTPNKPPPRLLQIVPEKAIKDMGDGPISLGAWIWASEAIKIRSPMIVKGDQAIFKEIEVDQNPKFFTITSELEKSDRPLIIALSPFRGSVQQNLSTNYDGIVLTSGNHPNGSIPEFSNLSGDSGVWNGIPFQNAIRNSSGENTWPLVKEELDSLTSRYFPGRPSLVLASILDARNFRNYYLITLKFLFQSFWARFGWGNVAISGYRSYLILAIFTLIGVLGAIISFVRNRARINWALLLFLGLPVIAIWSVTLARGVSSYLSDHFIVPVARYAYPAIIPTMIMIDIGWLEIGNLGNDLLKVPKKGVYAAFITFLVGLNILAIYSIFRFYQG